MKAKYFFRVLTLLYLAAGAVICFANFSSVPTFSGTLFGLPKDKVVHFSMFFPFTVLAALSFPPASRKALAKIGAVLLYLLCGSLLAALTEYVQGKLPYRSMDPHDFVADALGLLAGSFILVFIFARRRGRRRA